MSKTPVWLRYAVSGLAVLAALAVREALQPLLAGHAPMLVFTLAVMVAARFGGAGPALAATLLSALAGWFFLFDPRDSFVFKGFMDTANLALFVLVGAGLTILSGHLHRAIGQVESSAEQLHALSASLISAQEDERRRISRELHDDLTQRLCAMAIDLGRLTSVASMPRPELLEELHILQQRAVESAELTRHIAHELHPSILDDLGLEAALRAYCEEFGRRQGIEVDLICVDLPHSMKRETCSCIYALVQESLQNIAKHAQARRVSVELEGVRNGVRLDISDDGVGFVPNAAGPRVGLGIVNMRERVRALKGIFAVESHPGRGTRISASMPV